MIENITRMGMASVGVIIIVLILRYFLRNYSKKYMCALWGLVLVRLLCPVFIEGSANAGLIKYYELFGFEYLFAKEEVTEEKNNTQNREDSLYSYIQENSIYNETEFIPNDAEECYNTDLTYESLWEINGNTASGYINRSGADILSEYTNRQVADVSGIYISNQGKGFQAVYTDSSSGVQGNNGEGIQSEREALTEEKHNDSLSEQQNTDIAEIIWLTGMFIVAGYFVLRYIAIRRCIADAVHENDNIWRCGHVSSPFVMGFFKARIYIPYSISEEEYDYILRHEQMHIRHKDLFIKFAGIMAVCIHWWNLPVWYAVYKMNQDIEMFCDEAVTEAAGIAEKKAYSMLLLNFAVKQGGSPVVLSFGETNTEKRIKHILGCKKSKKAVSILVIAVGIIAGIISFVIPASGKGKTACNDSSNSIAGNEENQQTDMYTNISKEAGTVEISEDSGEKKGQTGIQSEVAGEGDYYVYFTPGNATGNKDNMYAEAINNTTGYLYGDVIIYDSEFREIRSFEDVITTDAGVHNSNNIVLGFMLKGDYGKATLYSGIYDIVKGDFSAKPEKCEYRVLDEERGYYIKAERTEKTHSYSITDVNGNELVTEIGGYDVRENYYVILKSCSEIVIYDKELKIIAKFYDEEADIPKKADGSYEEGCYKKDYIYYVDNHGNPVTGREELYRSFVEKYGDGEHFEYEDRNLVYQLPVLYQITESAKDEKYVIAYNERLYVFDAGLNILNECEDPEYIYGYDMATEYIYLENYYMVLNSETGQEEIYTYDGKPYVMKTESDTTEITSLSEDGSYILTKISGESLFIEEHVSGEDEVYYYEYPVDTEGIRVSYIAAHTFAIMEETDRTVIHTYKKYASTEYNVYDIALYNENTMLYEAQGKWITFSKPAKDKIIFMINSTETRKYEGASIDEYDDTEADTYYFGVIEDESISFVSEKAGELLSYDDAFIQVNIEGKTYVFDYAGNIVLSGIKDMTEIADSQADVLIRYYRK